MKIRRNHCIGCQGIAVSGVGVDIQEDLGIADTISRSHPSRSGIEVPTTLVEVIPDVIIDGKIGYIIENNPVRVHRGERGQGAELPPDLWQIAEDGRRFVGGGVSYV